MVNYTSRKTQYNICRLILPGFNYFNFENREKAEKLYLHAMNIRDKLSNAVAESNSVLVAGIDPDIKIIPDSFRSKYDDTSACVLNFCREFIDETAPFVCGYKLNLAFFEALGSSGLDIFLKVRKSVPDGKLIIADAKRGDIGNTAQKYAEAFFDTFDCDYITLNPLMGTETMEPFTGNPHKGIFVLALTSNNGADDFLLQPYGNGKSLSTLIAEKAGALNDRCAGDVGLVIGATQARHFAEVLPVFPSATLLIPGIGAQGGSVEELMRELGHHKGYVLPVISRSIMYASRGSDWKEKAVEAAQTYAGIFNVFIKR